LRVRTGPRQRQGAEDGPHYQQAIPTHLDLLSVDAIRWLSTATLPANQRLEQAVITIAPTMTAPGTIPRILMICLLLLARFK
jgi:hypothetical protein